MRIGTAIRYLWELFDLGLAAGPRVVDACATIAARRDELLAKYGETATPIFTKVELDRLALGY